MLFEIPRNGKDPFGRFLLYLLVVILLVMAFVLLPRAIEDQRKREAACAKWFFGQCIEKAEEPLDWGSPAP